MRNVSIRAYSKMQDVSGFGFLKHLEPKNDFNGVSFELGIMTYEEVKSVIKRLGTIKTIEDIVPIFKTCFKCDEETFFDSGIVEFIQAKKFLLERFKKLVEDESKLLRSVDIDIALWDAAGGKRLNKHSDVLPLMQLGEIYSVYPFSLESKPYLEILTLLRANKVKSEVDNSYQKLKRN